MRRAARVDANQADIVADLRAVGVSVFITSQVGGGFPDIVCGWRGRTVLIEIKDGNKPPSARKLTEAEQEFHDSWRGQVAVAENTEQALSIIGIEVNE